MGNKVLVSALVFVFAIFSCGMDFAVVNGKEVLLQAPPVNQQGSSMVPLRFVSEKLGATVIFNKATQEVTITAEMTSEAGGVETETTNRDTGGSTDGAAADEVTVLIQNSTLTPQELKIKQSKALDSLSPGLRNGEKTFIYYWASCGSVTLSGRGILY